MIAVHKTALTNLEEKGIGTCFAGIGLATWNVDQGTEPNAPVILVPLHTTPTGAATRDYEVSVAGDAHLNPVLAHILRSEHSIDTDDTEADLAEDPPASLEAFDELFDQLAGAWSELPRFAITPRVVCGNFSYSTMPLVHDLEQNTEALAQNDLVAAIAGVPHARAALSAQVCDPSPSQPDADPLESEFLILDADSSQHRAINQVLGGESLVIQGPPGTGKSQTISNLIAALAARGKRVLFVAEMIPMQSSLFDVVIFDVVIFDEASQIPPAEAISSLARARQAVIAGDSRQLPPTTFFGRESYEHEGVEDDTDFSTGDVESLLDLADVFLRDAMLTWHCRSRDDRLIAFSNKHVCSGSLTAFPGTDAAPPVTHHEVEFRALAAANGTRSNPDEARYVAERVLEHARTSPHETLGVIAFGQAHADAIEGELSRLMRDLEDQSLDAFFSEANEERFFVKNIERVQGDERDAIVLSVGYHKDANGRLLYRFGPLNQEGGERRLNVAVTRARSRLALVSSFSHRDMAPDRSSARGAELLRQYLSCVSIWSTPIPAARCSDRPHMMFRSTLSNSRYSAACNVAAFPPRRNSPSPATGSTSHAPIPTSRA